MPSPTIQFKRGNAGIAGTLPVALKEGEPAFTLNYQDFYIGLDETVNNNKFFGSSRYWRREDNNTSLRFALVDKDGINNIQLKSPDSLSGITTYTLPETPVNSYFLKTDEYGNLSWSSDYGDITVQSITAGIGTFTNKLTVTSVTDSFDINTGALVVDGGVGIEKNLNIGGNLSVQGTSEFVGIVTFRGGVINIGDSGEDDVNIIGEIISNLVPNTDNTFNIGIGTNKRWKNANFAGIGTFESGAKLNNIALGLFENNTIQTFAGSLILDSNEGTVFINDNLVVSGVSTFLSNLDLNASLDVQNQTQLNTLDVSGISTFGSNVEINASLDVQNQTQLNTLDVSGISTFSSNVDINASLDVQNQTLLNLLNVSGISTFNNTVSFGSSVYFGDDNSLNIGNGNDLRLLHDGSNSYIQDLGTGSLYIQSNEYVIQNASGSENFARFLDNSSVQLYYDSLRKFETTGYGATVLGTLQSQGIVISGISTFVSNLNIDASIDVQNNTQLNTLNVSGLSTFLSNIDLNASLDVQNQTQLNLLNVSGISTFGSNVDVNASFDVQNNTQLNTLNVSGLSTFLSNVDLNASLDVQNQTQLNTLAVSGISTFSSNANFNNNLIVSGNGQFGSATISGVVTSTGGFDGDLTGNAGTATSLANSRTFEITGDVVASAISFDGTGNVSLAATIQPNSVGLGTDTFGDYIKSISGTENQITVTGGTGEGSTPVISIPDSPVLPGNVTIQNDLLVNNNLNIYGNIMIGGTVAVVAVEELLVKDKQLLLGFTTDFSGNNVSNDSTANGGGISIASTEGSPLVDFYIAGIHTHPSTYKDIIWIKSGTLGAGTTDAWHLNYAVGIGSTQVPNNVVLAAGAVQFTNDDLIAVRNINVSGVSTFASNVDINASLDVQNHTQLNTLNVSGVGTFTSDLTADNNLYVNQSTILNRLNVTGLSTFSSVDVSGQTELNSLNVSGISTFISPATFNNITVNGSSQLNNLNVSGVTTFNSVSVAGTSIFDKVILQSLWVNDCAGTSQVINCIGVERILQNITIDCGTY